MLRKAIEDYLKIRRSVGYELKVTEGLLYNFLNFLADRGEVKILKQSAIDWAAQAPSPKQRENRLSMVRKFVLHLRAEDPTHELIPQRIFAHKHKRLFPHIFSAVEIAQLIEGTARLSPKGSMRPQIYYTLFGLMAVTGLRISEAMRLTFDDITKDGLIIRKTKFRKSRLVPLHITTVNVLESYLKKRKTLFGTNNHVFTATHGGVLSYPMVNGTFHFLLRSLKLHLKPEQPLPRIHDFRHSFAVHSLENSKRENISQHITALSTYLGHAYVTGTYWYLQATPHLMSSIADACESFIEGDGK